MDCIDARVVALQVIEAHEKKISNPYDCLLLPRTASFLDVKAAYKRLLFLHPDKNPTLDVAHEAFKVVVQAYNEIKEINSQTRVPDLQGGNNNAAPVGHKWRAYTSAQAAEQVIHVDVFRGGIPSQPPAAPPPPQQQSTAWSSLHAQHSKWGRPSADAHSLLKDLKTSASRLKPASLPQRLESEERDVQHRAARPSKQENDLSKPSFGELHESNEHGDAMEINCGLFYGDTRRSAAGNKQNQKQRQQRDHMGNPVPSSSRAPFPPLSQDQKLRKEGAASTWSEVSKNHPLAELLRNPEVAAPVATMKDVEEEGKMKKQRSGPRTKSKAQQKRQRKTRVIINSDSDDDFNNHKGKEREEKELLGAESDSTHEDERRRDGAGGSSSNSSDGWDSKEEEEIIPESKIESIVSDSTGEAKSKALINLLLAQQRSQARHRLHAGAGQKASQKATFARRGGKRRKKQSRLRLGPITSK
jgi:hypothetical protein